MGAVDFYTEARGKTAQEAFNKAIDQARYDHGHAGYTGSIAEKHAFVIIQVPAGSDPHHYAGRLIDQADPRIRDKWGPAGCISLGDGRWLFFGWASS